MAKIHIENRNVTIESSPGRSLLISLLISKQPIHTVCGGKAGCGCCRVKILEGGEKLSPVRECERAHLDAVLINSGWRLACQTYLLRDIKIYVPTAAELDSVCSK